jgi:hypothetical protein
MNRLLIVAAIAVSVTACAETMQERAARHAQTCTSYGFIADQPAFADCMMSVDLAEKQRAAAMSAAIIASY